MLLERQAEIRLVLTDDDMPVLDGAALIHQVRKQFPTLPILLMSGQATATGSGGDAILTKPFSSDTLLERVHRSLHARAADRLR